MKKGEFWAENENKAKQNWKIMKINYFQIDFFAGQIN